jgi:hypothetical protein
MSTNKEPWEPLLEKLNRVGTDYNEQYVAVLLLFKGLKDNDIAILRRYSDAPYSASSMPSIISGLLNALSQNGDPKIRELIAKELGGIASILLHDLIKIRSFDTPQLLSLTGTIKDGLLRASQNDDNATVRRASLKALEKMARPKPWWKFW